MKFSYSLIKEMVADLPAKKKFIKEFPLKSFEIDSVDGDVLDIKITANRWCDASSHRGVAKEAAAIFNLKTNFFKTADFKKTQNNLNILVSKDSGCNRYIGLFLEIYKTKNNLIFLKKIKNYLSSCGIKSINPVVDILNYVMIETGQPMHAFDADKIEGNIVVRKAASGERIITIDGKEYILSSEDTVIADQKKILAIAGIKGGKAAEISDNTKKIIIESANFNPVSVYRSSKRIKLETDASRRYGHGMSSKKAEEGMARALCLLKEIYSVNLLSFGDIYKIKEPNKFIKLDLKKLNKIAGADISADQAITILKKLGFNVKNGLVEVPKERMDIAIFEDLAEEIIRMRGFDEIESKPPVLSIISAHSDPIFIFKEKIKKILVSAGFDEIISYSFGNYPDSAVKLLNPLSADKSYMRNNLSTGLGWAVEKNKKIFKEIKIFEFGKIFKNILNEHWSLSVAVKMLNKENAIRILRGSVNDMFCKIGINDVLFLSEENKLLCKIGKEKVGEIFILEDGETAVFEANAEQLMECSEGEFEYEQMSLYPSITRDISFWSPNNLIFEKILEIINDAQINHLNDVDLVDYYPDREKNKTGITLRIIFQSFEKTLTDEEINKETDKIKSVLESQKEVELR